MKDVNALTTKDIKRLVTKSNNYLGSIAEDTYKSIVYAVIGVECNGLRQCSISCEYELRRKSRAGRSVQGRKS